MQDVKKDRDKYIGGSDIPIIMGLSPFKTRWRLLQEKADIVPDLFEGNAYTEYGNIMEPQIREAVNDDYDCSFVEDKIIKGDLRYHADGWDADRRTVLEIKTTSHMADSLDGYRKYLVQLALGMYLYKADDGILAVYERPEDFSRELIDNRLQIWPVRQADIDPLMPRILSAVDSFREDLARLRENPFLTEQDFQPNEVVVLANQIVALESQLAVHKQFIENYDAMRRALKDAMQEHGVKSWTMPNGTKVTLVPDGEDTTVRKFNEKRFKRENPDTWEKYAENTPKKGRAGYVRITYGKGV